MSFQTVFLIKSKGPCYSGPQAPGHPPLTPRTAPTQVLNNPRCFPAHAAHTGLRAFIHAAPLPGTFLPLPLLGSPLPTLPKDLPKSDGSTLPEAHGAAPSQRSWLECTWLVTSLTPLQTVNSVSTLITSLSPGLSQSLEHMVLNKHVLSERVNTLLTDPSLGDDVEATKN